MTKRITVQVKQKERGERDAAWKTVRLEREREGEGKRTEGRD